MILSVSRRTDIPNYYSAWFLERVKEGYLYVRNPMNHRQLSKIIISPETVEGMVFWTKNPAAMLPGLCALREYPYYFQFTLTGYGRDVEPGLPDKKTVLIPVFKKVSGQIGSHRVIWRYDPVFVNHRKASGQRGACGCCESRDVGTYHTCRNGCRYCYANDSEKRVMESIKNYDVHSPILCGRLTEEEKYGL